MEKANRKRIKRLSVVLYIVILCLFVTATLSWFIFDKTASIESDGNMQVTAGSRLEITLNYGEDAETWGDDFTVSTDEKAYPDITGNGKDFYFPTALDKNDSTFNSADTFHKIELAEANNYYITVNVTFRTTANTSVYLANDSYVSPINLNVTDENKSVYGDISRDGIAGAVRVAFIDTSAASDEALKNIWIPNDKYELGYDENGNAVFNENGERESSYGYQLVSNGTVESFTYTPEEYANLVTVGTAGALASPSTETVPAQINQAKELLTFDGNGTMQTKTLTVRIWIEGTDREADKALAGGKLKYKFNFICIDKTMNDNEANVGKIALTADNKLAFNDETLDANTLKNVAEYSVNGLEWTTYTGEALTFQSTDEAVCVRYKETVGQRASSIKVVSLKN